MAAITISSIAATQCQVTEVNLRDLAVRKAARPKKSASPDQISISAYHNDLKTIIGPDLYASYSCLLSSSETTNNPFFHGGCVYVEGTGEFYITSDLLQTASSSQLPVILISRVKTFNNGSDSISTVEWLKLRPPPNMPMPAGGTKYKQGVLFCAQGNLTPGTGGLYYMEIGKPPEPVVTNYFGKDFNSIQDVAVTRDGSLWFTDSPSGFHRDFRPRPQLPAHIYRFVPETGELRVVADGRPRPHGIAFSPDESTLYVTSTDTPLEEGSTDTDRAASIHAFDVVDRAGGPFLANKRIFVHVVDGAPMGVDCDARGNVYAGCGSGLGIWSPAGVLLGMIEVPGGVTTFAFGKSHEVFLCSEQRFWRLKYGRSEQLI